MSGSSRRHQGDTEGVARRREADRQSRTQRVSSDRGQSDVQARMGQRPATIRVRSERADQ